MDNTDVKLLELLSEHADCTAQEMSKHVNMSVAAINKRIAKLEADGIIERYTIQLNLNKVGKPVVAYILLVVDQFSESERLLKYVEEEPDIVECHSVTGEYDYLIKVCAKDVVDLEDKLLRLKRQGGVCKTNTLLSLMENKHLNGPLPDRLI